MSLKELVDNHYTDKDYAHGYLELYEKLLKGKKETALNVLEVGIYNGGSILLWSDYFKNSTVYGLDNNPDLNFIIDKVRNKENVRIYTGIDAYNNDFFTNEFLNKNIKFDLLLDDGPHSLESFLQFINLYSQVMTDDGILIIEDIPFLDWTEILKNAVPENLKQFVKIYDIRETATAHYQHDNIVFTIDKFNI